ncbi:hypothetical protein [Spirillospora sp. NBC_01491]|uniref:hypothetical protein n=1 Tax=Spirillospora sp. NBC_01491 TaxID=2976007 RepID=UPI002E336115|nr:hypothetical protein [Spirillospora sp. NBC_01491]
MLDLWRGTLSPRTVLNLIDRLPRDSHYVAAMADDDDLADQLAAREDDKTPAPPPPMTDWSADQATLTLIADRLGELLTLTAAANSKKKPPSYKPLPRPVTAAQRAKRRRRERKYELVTTALATAAAQGRPSMDSVTADPTHTAAPPKRR